MGRNDIIKQNGMVDWDKVGGMNDDIKNLGTQMADIVNSSESALIPLRGFMGINGAGSGVGWGSEYRGILNVRTAPEWASVESTLGVYDFTGFDSQHQAAQQYHQKLYIGLGNNNLLYGGVDNTDKAILDDTAIAAHLNYVAAVAERYKGYGYMYAFWNEPDVYDQYHYGAYPQKYVDMVKNMYNTIKTHDPTSIVCMPDCTSGIGDSVSIGGLQWFAKVCELGLLDYTDEISVHTYMYPPEELIEKIHQIRTIVKRYTSINVPIIITEFGWSSAPGIVGLPTEEERAKYVTRFILLALYCDIKKIFIYTTRTNRSDAASIEDWFGIYNTDDLWSELPIATAIREFMTANLDCVFAGKEESNKNDYIFKLMDLTTKNIKYAVWTTDVSHTVKLPTGDSAVLIDTVQVISTTKQLDIFDIINTLKYNDYSEPVKRLSNYNEVFNDLINNMSTGSYNHSEGYFTTANGTCCHSEGNMTSAVNFAAHAEGNQTLASTESHAEGTWTLAYPGTLYKITAYDSTNNTITVDSATGLVVGNKLAIYRTTAIPIIITITAINGNILTVDTTPTNIWFYGIYYNVNQVSTSHAQNQATLACGTASDARGYNTIANTFASSVMGTYNTALNGNAKTYSGTADAFVIGNGVNNSTRGNAFRVTFAGATYGLSAFNSTGADYSEYFEWLDENPNKEDRVGYFITLNGEKIRKATSQDNYILGIVSATPSVIGDSCQDDWKDKYITDDWGRIQYETVNISEVKDKDGNIIIPTHTELRPKINPNWDSNKNYIPREQRPEWSPIGMMGKLLARDDGTCVINSFCKSNDNGIATKSDTGYRVLKRVSSNIVMILFK